MPKVYTFGYGGRNLADLLHLVWQLDAVVFDVRYSPRSRNPQWGRDRLKTALNQRYRHVREFGNVNYKGGPIHIVDYEAGKQRIADSDRDVILMCVCKDPGICHRTTIARKLREDGFEVEEIGSPFGMQQSLWGDGP